MQSSNYVYIAVTNDEYELVLACFDKAKELGEWAGIRPDNLCTMIRTGAVCRKYDCKFHKVYIGG